MRTVFVAGYRGEGDCALAWHSASVVGFGEECVHMVEHPLRDAGDLAHPDRPIENQDVVSENSLS